VEPPAVIVAGAALIVIVGAGGGGGGGGAGASGGGGGAVGRLHENEARLTSTRAKTSHERPNDLPPRLAAPPTTLP
jgi:hypothetical protein